MARSEHPKYLEVLGQPTVLLALLVLGAVMSWSAHVGNEGYGFMEPLGHALLIAAFLALTVEGTIRVRFAREVSKDVAGALMGYRLPVELQDHIRDSMRAVNLVLADYRTEFRFSAIPSDVTRIAVDVRTEFRVVNYGKEDAPYQSVLQAEELHAPRFHSLNYLGPESRSLEGESLQKRVKREQPEVPDGQGVSRVEGPEITIAGQVGDDPPAEVSVVWRYTLIMPAEGTEVIYFGRHTIGAEVRAEWGEDLGFWISPDKCREDGVRHWRFHRLFLPAQQIRIRWFRKPQA